MFSIEEDTLISVCQMFSPVYYMVVVQSSSRNSLCLHCPLPYPMLSFPFKFNNLLAVFLQGIPPAPLAHRQAAESVGNLTQHKLHCEAEVSESVGCFSADRGTMEM